MPAHKGNRLRRRTGGGPESGPKGPRRAAPNESGPAGRKPARGPSGKTRKPAKNGVAAPGKRSPPAKNGVAGPGKRSPPAKNGAVSGSKPTQAKPTKRAKRRLGNGATHGPAPNGALRRTDGARRAKGARKDRRGRRGADAESPMDELDDILRDAQGEEQDGSAPARTTMEPEPMDLDSWEGDVRGYREVDRRIFLWAPRCKVCGGPMRGPFEIQGGIAGPDLHGASLPEFGVLCPMCRNVNFLLMGKWLIVEGPLPIAKRPGSRPAR